VLYIINSFQILKHITKKLFERVIGKLLCAILDFDWFPLFFSRLFRNR